MLTGLGAQNCHVGGRSRYTAAARPWNTHHILCSVLCHQARAAHVPTGAHRSGRAFLPASVSPSCCSGPSRRRWQRAAAASEGGPSAPSEAHPDWQQLLRGADPARRECERSSLVNEETVYLIFQLELDSQLQRALNYEAYEAAQQVRQKRETVDLAIRNMQERKAATGGGQQEEAKLSMTDLAAEGLRLRTEMQRAVEEERYQDAAKFRDLIGELEKRSKQAQAEAQSSNTPRLRLGQRVLHRDSGYRGVVVGWDLQCCEDDTWIQASHADQLEHGLAQPFYHVLVDVRDWDFDASQPPVAYVAQELLYAPELNEAEPSSWKEAYGDTELNHPYSYMLFLGPDARGDLLPCRQLRDKFNAARRDVYAPGQDGTEPGEGDDDDAPPPPKKDGGGPPPSGPRIPGIDMSSLQ